MGLKRRKFSLLDRMGGMGIWSIIIKIYYPLDRMGGWDGVEDYKFPSSKDERGGDLAEEDKFPYGKYKRGGGVGSGGTFLLLAMMVGVGIGARKTTCLLGRIGVVETGPRRANCFPSAYFLESFLCIYSVKLWRNGCWHSNCDIKVSRLPSWKGGG